MAVITPKYVSIPEAGRRLGRSARTIKRLVAQGLLSSVAIQGTQTKVPVDEIEAFIAAGHRDRKK